MDNVQGKATSGNESPLFRWRTMIGGSDLSATEKLVALVLSLRMDSEGSCFPSVKRIASDASLDPRTVQRVLRRLKDKRYLRVQTGGGRRRSNRYLVAFPGGKDGSESDKGRPSAAVSSEKGGPESQEGRHRTTRTRKESVSTYYGDSDSKSGSEETTTVHSSSRSAPNVPGSWSDVALHWQVKLAEKLDLVQQEMEGTDEERELVGDGLREALDSGRAKPSLEVVRDEWERVRKLSLQAAWAEDEDRPEWKTLLIEEYDELGGDLLENPSGPPPKIIRTKHGARIDPVSIQDAAIERLRRNSILRRRYVDRLVGDCASNCLRCQDLLDEGDVLCAICRPYKQTAQRVLDAVRSKVQEALSNGVLLAPVDIEAEWPDEEPILAESGT